ncbi:4-hydroxybenzoate polyprenyltransferase [Rhodococcus sp. 27YEA15]|uniref:hypothetical protein n=1 Tax=Rhodococcus sp. 27YEA15 TaxID=3156259 RepID=UPI003C7C2EBC
MTTTSATLTSPFVVRLTAYSNERFPVWQVIGEFPMFLSAFLFGQAIAGKNTEFTPLLFAGFVAFVAYTLLVRVIDDHKDQAHDNEHYPERVLQRGLVTYTHLKIIGVICIVASIVVSLVADRGIGLVTMWWVFIFVTNNLMQLVQVKIPAIGEWLESRRVILALTVIPFWGLGSVWVAQMGAGERGLSVQVWWLVAVWCAAALLLEIARKSRTPEDTRATVVDYTKPTSSWTRSLGLVGTVVTLLALAALVTVLECALLSSSGHGVWWAYLGIGITLLLPAGAAARFALAPSRVRAKDVAETSAGIWVIGQIVTAVALVVI